MKPSETTPLLVPLTEFGVCLTLDALWARFREEHRIREIWVAVDGQELLSEEAFKNRARFLRILLVQQQAALN